jgi:hypothetical protein
MSFGISISDILEITKLINDIITRTRGAAGELQHFTDDLGLAATLFHQLRSNIDTYNRYYNGLQPTQRQTTMTVFRNIHHSLTELQTSLAERYSSVGRALNLRSNLRFSHALPELRQRLEVHMRSLSLLVQSVQLVQTSQVQAVLARIEEAQQEGRPVLGDMNQVNGMYGRSGGSSTAATAATSVRDEFIADWQDEITRWRNGVQSNETSTVNTTSFESETAVPMDHNGIASAKRWCFASLLLEFTLMSSILGVSGIIVQSEYDILLRSE